MQVALLVWLTPKKKSNLGTSWVLFGSPKKGGGGGVKTYFLGWKNSTSQNRDFLPPLYFLDSARIVVGSFLWSR